MVEQHSEISGDLLDMALQYRRIFPIVVYMPEPTVSDDLPHAITELPKRRTGSEHALALEADRTVIEMSVKTRHQKDVSIDRLDDHYYMISSASEVDDQSDWKMRSYVAPTMNGPWASHGVVEVEGAQSPRTCAAGVICEESLQNPVTTTGEPEEANKKEIYRMLVQTECFAEGGTIEYAESDDGLRYTKRRTILSSKPGTAMAGIYDSEPTVIVTKEGRKELYFTFTGVRRYEEGKAKDGAIFLAKAENGWDGPWQVIDTPMFTEYSIPPHVPTKEGGEWVPEGGKALQISVGEHDETNVLFYGTCFVDGEIEDRQRGFLAIANEITGEYTFLGLLEPRNGIPGETGHGTLIEEKDEAGNTRDDKVHIIHQARDKGTGLWRTERATYRKGDILELFAQKQKDMSMSLQQAT